MVDPEEYFDGVKDAATAYVNGLPRFREELRGAIEGRDTATTTTLRTQYVDTLKAVMARLAEFYPVGTFDSDPQAFFSEQMAARWRLHSEHVCPPGLDVGGSFYGMVLTELLVRDAEQIVADLVMSLVGVGDTFNWRRREANWRKEISTGDEAG